MKRLLVSSAALLWGLQFAFLIPSMALILVTLLLTCAGLTILALIVVWVAGRTRRPSAGAPAQQLSGRR